MRLLVFTDLDGTLLDHADYSYRGAAPALERLAAERIPLVMVTSKTRREVEELQARMGIVEPFVVENGGGIFFPAPFHDLDLPAAQEVEGYRLLQLGVSYHTIRDFLRELPDDFAVRGFGDMSLEEVQRATGLPEERARLARAREFTEPFLLPDEGRVEELRSRARRAGLEITRGGRFLHLMGAGQDKGRAVRRVTEAFRTRWNEAGITTVGLGDSENDVPMLRVVDVPVLIPNPGGSAPEIQGETLIRGTRAGSVGWNESLQSILDGFV